MSDQSTYSQALAKNEKHIQERIFWQQIAWMTSLCCAVLLCTAAGALWYFKTELMLAPVLHWSAFGTLIVITLLASVLTTQSATLMRLLQQQSLYNQLRIDVHQAVLDSLDSLLAQHVPGYRSVHTHLNVGEELLRAVEYQAKRRVDFARAVEQKLPGIELGRAINQYIAESLAALEVRNRSEALERIFGELSTEDTLVQFPRRE